MATSAAAAEKCGTAEYDIPSDGDMALARLYKSCGEIYINENVFNMCLVNIRHWINIPSLKNHILKHQVIGRKELDEITNHYHSYDDQIDDLLESVGRCGGRHGYFLLYVSLCESSENLRSHKDAVHELQKKAIEMKVCTPENIVHACRVLDREQTLQHTSDNSGGVNQVVKPGQITDPDRMFNKLALEMFESYNEIGLELGLKQDYLCNELETGKFMMKKGSEKALKMLQLWQKSGGVNFTYSALAAALKQHGYERAALKFCYTEASSNLQSKPQKCGAPTVNSGNNPLLAIASQTDSGYGDSVIYKCITNCEQNCTLNDYMDGTECQKSANNGFPFLSLPSDSYEGRKLKTALSEQSRAISDDFVELADDTFQQLRKIGFDEIYRYTNLIVSTRNYDSEVFGHQPARNCIAEPTTHKDLEIVLMQNYYSWFNFGMIKKLRNKFLFPDCSGNDKLLLSYEESFSNYCRRRCFESPMLFHPQPVAAKLTSLVFKVDEQFNNYTLLQVDQIRSTVEKVIKSHDYAIYVGSVNEGCVKVSCYLLPEFRLSQLNEVQISQLKGHNIISFMMDDKELLPEEQGDKEIVSGIFELKVQKKSVGVSRARPVSKTSNNNNKISFKEEQGDKEKMFDDFERERVKVRKKDSVTRARPVSTTSIGSFLHDSVSKRAAAGIGSIAEGEGGVESQVLELYDFQVAEASSSTHSRFPRNKRKLSSTSSDGESELESSTHSYISEFDQDCPCSQEQITVSAESISTITKRISVLEETVCELSKDRVRVRELEEVVRILREELIVLRKSDTKKTELHQGFTASLKTLPEQDEKQAEISRNQEHATDSANPSPSSRCEDDISNVSKVEITCEAQASTKNTNSPPFFSDSGNCGYQMCITLSRNDHIDPELKFSLVIMRSKHDKKLPWPFRREVRVILVHNVDQSKDNVLVIKPKSEKSFQRPKSDLNEPFVFLQKHYTGLFDGGFISNDDKVNFLVNVT